MIVALRSWDPECRAFLFGSRARGDHLKGSDYDLLIISRKFKGIPFTARAGILLRVLGPWADRVEVLCYTPDEFKRKSKELGVVSEAIKEGRSLLP